MGIAVLHESAIEDAPPSRSAGARATAADRRSQVRLTAEDASWLSGARLKYGPEVRVIDISTGGVLVECDGAPLPPQSTVVFELSAQTGTMLMPARVLRSQSVAGGARHQTACAFKRPLSIETLAAVTRHEAPAQSSAAAGPRVGWQRVVARFRNGKVVRGYTNDFHPSKPHLHLTPEDNNSDAMFVVVSQLKAVFFVRDFAGDPSRVDSTEFDTANHGRKVEVTFQDGEVLRGTTLGYRNDGTGFFIQPADTGSNNMRVFVAPGSTRSVKFL
jgi:hypothetical protein